MDLKNHIFKAGGAAAGLITGLGLFGIIFGFLGGALIDQLTKSLRQKNRLKKFFTGPQEFTKPDSELISASAAACVWSKCSEDPFKRSIFEEELHSYLKAVPRCCVETLKEIDSISMPGIEQYFELHADEQIRADVERLKQSCGLNRKANEPAASEEDYRLLGLEPGAQREEVKKVFRRLAGQFHPDSGANLSSRQQQLSEEAFRKIREAYERIVHSVD